jgi:hypothetical protein
MRPSNAIDPSFGSLGEGANFLEQLFRRLDRPRLPQLSKHLAIHHCVRIPRFDRLPDIWIEAPSSRF